MTELQELKYAYAKLKNQYFARNAIKTPSDPDDYTELVFRYYAMGDRVYFSYMIYDEPERDEVAFGSYDDDVNEIGLPMPRYIAVTEFINALNKHIHNGSVLNDFMDFLRKEEDFKCSIDIIV
jgi:hypothetical protein